MDVPCETHLYHAEERIKELEAELATSKANNQKYCITIAELESERDKAFNAGLEAAAEAADEYRHVKQKCYPTELAEVIRVLKE